MNHINHSHTLTHFTYIFHNFCMDARNNCPAENKNLINILYMNIYITLFATKNSPATHVYNVSFRWKRTSLRHMELNNLEREECNDEL